MTSFTRRVALGVCPPALLFLFPASLAAAPQNLDGGCDFTYTTDAHFDLGTLLNVNHNAPNSDQLQLNVTAAPLPFVYIACSARGTVVRVDVNTGTILGEYLTAPSGMGRDPSRTTVDRFGNVWLSNRAEGGFSGTENKGSIARIGIVIGGTRGNKDPAGGFTPDPNGLYLQPPFQYSTCLDRDGDGLIKTSLGLGSILPWTNAGGADTHGGVTTAEDECIINYTRIAGTAARTVAIDANNDVWTGGLGDLDHEKVDGITGLPIPGTKFNVGCGGYGGLIDGAGILWSARGGSGLLRRDVVAGTHVCLNSTHGDYGLGIDPVTGNIWHTNLGGNRIAELDPAGNLLNAYNHGNSSAQGCAVDGSGNVWVAHSLFSATTVGHLRTDGTHVGNVDLGSHGGNGPTGVAVDSNGKVWVANINSNNAMRIDPAMGPPGGGGFPVGAVDLVVDLGPGASPYNYSDMTGFVTVGTTAPSGTWTVVQDGLSAGTDWGTFSWTGSEPPGTSLLVEVRADDLAANLPNQAFVPVSNGSSNCGSGITGRFVEVRVTFSRSPGVNDTPILFDLTANCCGGVQPPTIFCPPDVTERWEGGPPNQTRPERMGFPTFNDPCGPNPTINFSDSFQPGTQPGEPETIITRTWTLTNTCGFTVSCDQTITLLSPSSSSGGLHLDVGPGSCPNVVQVFGGGNTVLALTGTSVFDASTIDLASLRVSRVDGAGATLDQFWAGIGDVATPFFGAAGACHAAGADGRGDVVLEVSNSVLRRALRLGSEPDGAAVELRVTGRLTDGRPFEGRDRIVVRR